MNKNKFIVRDQVKSLCELLSGEMVNNTTDQFILNGYTIDLSTTNVKFLAIETIEQLINQAVKTGKDLKSIEIRNTLNITL